MTVCMHGAGLRGRSTSAWRWKKRPLMTHRWTGTGSGSRRRRQRYSTSGVACMHATDWTEAPRAPAAPPWSRPPSYRSMLRACCAAKASCCMRLVEDCRERGSSMHRSQHTMPTPVYCESGTGRTRDAVRQLHADLMVHGACMRAIELT